MSRKPVIGVMGGADAAPHVLETAGQIGRIIASRGWVLLNGGRNVGVMDASAQGAREAGGFVVGVLPGASTVGASPHLDLAIVTGMGDARNVVNVLSSDVVIALPGGAGTVSEVALALKAGRPVVLVQWQAGAALAGCTGRRRLHEAESAEAAMELAGRLLRDRLGG